MVVSRAQRMPLEPFLRAFAARALNRLLAKIPRAQRLAQRLGWQAPDERVHWFGARTVGEAARALTERVGRFKQPSEWVLLIGQDGPLAHAVGRQFDRLSWEHRRVSTVQEAGPQTRPPTAVVSVDVNAARVTDTARAALSDPGLAGLPFEYVTGLEPERLQFQRQDEYRDDLFISPVLLAKPSPYAIYEMSLERFEQKCGLRDYLDLYQLLGSVHERGVPGEVTEFGSYKGHSGWLIGKTLEALGSAKSLHMFDMFESFPRESAGVDYFWSGTHHVSLEEVRARLSGLSSVELVPGEFERTLPASGLDRIALAYVDCDSYRAVSYLAANLFEDRISPGGVMVFEDYGHPALLGCRVAVHEYFDGRSDCLRFFSQFSGLYVVVKLEEQIVQP